MNDRQTQTNFLNEIKGSTANNWEMLSINEGNARKMLETHRVNGFAVISASRGDMTPDDNLKNTQQLISDIQQKGYSYTPMWGAFKENFGTPEETDVFERSIMVYNLDRSGNAQQMEGLIDFAVEMCNKYHQPSVLVMKPECNPEFITTAGGAGCNFDKLTTFNEFLQKYFSDLHDSHKEQSMKDGEGAPDVFTLNTCKFDDCYINPAPATLNEAHSRKLRGEVFLPYKHSANGTSAGSKK